MWWRMEEADKRIAQLPTPCPRPSRSLLVSLQAINSASKPHAAAIPEHHLMVSGGLRVQEKNTFIF